jgi:four helix bundle protein
MKNSKEYKNWQKDLTYLTSRYQIAAGNMLNEQVDIHTQILQAALSVPAKVEEILGKNTGSNVSQFLKSSATSLYELQNLLKISLNLNLISISEYHALSEKINEIGEMINNFIKIFKPETSSKKKISEKKELAFWTLN